MGRCKVQVKQRYVQAAVLFFLLGVSYVLRINFALLLTQMVFIPHTFEFDEVNDDSFEDLFCPVKMPQNDTAEEPDNDNRYEWSQTMQGVVLSSFFWGNIVSQIPSGLLVQKFGAKHVLLISTLLASAILLLTPLAVDYGDSSGLIATRVLYGILQGPLTSAVGTFSVGWFPIEERGRFNSIIFVGINVFGFLASYLISYAMEAFGKWSIVFYALGAATAVGCILFAFLCFNSPQQHPFIGAEEKAYLELKMSQYLEAEKKNIPPTPWKSILTSKPVIALLFSYGFFTFGITILNAGFPKYLNDVLHVSIKRNAVYQSAPRIAIIFISTFAGLLADFLITKRLIKLTKLRKIFAVISTLLTSTFMIGASFAGCDDELVPILFAISISGSGFDAAGQDVNGLDLAPNYIGVLSSLIITVATGASLIAPPIMTLMVPHAYLKEWRNVFWLAFGLYMGTLVIYTTFGSAEVQPWNSPQKPKLYPKIDDNLVPFSVVNEK